MRKVTQLDGTGMRGNHSSLRYSITGSTGGEGGGKEVELRRILDLLSRHELVENQPFLKEKERRSRRLQDLADGAVERGGHLRDGCTNSEAICPGRLVHLEADQAAN